MKDQDKCPDCDTWWEQCPCCGTDFCPDCKMLESDAVYDEEEVES
ncbi:hypothetical protein [Paenibacillus alvei]|nr:hypothetical protein [Paenibacillus alvei]